MNDPSKGPRSRYAGATEGKVGQDLDKVVGHPAEDDFTFDDRPNFIKMKF